jgi:hypothetical protein
MYFTRMQSLATLVRETYQTTTPLRTKAFGADGSSHGWETPIAGAWEISTAGAWSQNETVYAPGKEHCAALLLEGCAGAAPQLGRHRPPKMQKLRPPP